MEYIETNFICYSNSYVSNCMVYALSIKILLIVQLYTAVSKSLSCDERAYKSFFHLLQTSMLIINSKCQLYSIQT